MKKIQQEKDYEMAEEVMEQLKKAFPDDIIELC